MNRVFVLSAVIVILFAARICQADSLVITYSSGKTQKVVLDEPSVAIKSWQFVGKTPEQEQLQKNQTTQPESRNIPTKKSAEKKSGVRVILNAKPIPD